jgi:oxygen-independent coproporphyrinogen-3 oxidase
MKKKAGLYIHIPFCKRRCFYCHFVTVPFDSQMVDVYMEAVESEIQLRASSTRLIDSIYLGGGSPSLLNESHLFSLMESISKHFRLASDSEVSIECNPEDLSTEKLRIFKQAGFNRISIGIQSFLRNDLTYLERNHSATRSLEAVSQAMDLSFTNLNVDFIIGLPTQNAHTVGVNLSHVERLKIPHLSCYLLENNPKKPVSEKKETDLFSFLRKRIGQMGFSHYEISNFCKPGSECRHNLKYWKNQEYIGVGLSASGFQDGTDYKNVEDLIGYLKMIKNLVPPVMKINSINPASRKIITGLRLLEGLPATAFNRFDHAMKFLMAENLLLKRGRNIAVNPEKLLLLNEILSYFV